MEIKIREIRKSEIDSIIKLHQQGLSVFIDKNDLKKQIKSSVHVLKGAFFEGQLIAYLHIQIILPEVEIINIVVDKKYQRQRIGKKLIENLLSNNREVESIFLEVSKNNTKGYQFYKSLGFLEYGSRKKYYQDGSDAILMRKI